MKKLILALFFTAAFAHATTYVYSGSQTASATANGCSGCGNLQSAGPTSSSNLTYGSDQAVSGILNFSANLGVGVIYDSPGYCLISTNCAGEGTVSYQFSTDGGTTWSTFYSYTYSCNNSSCVSTTGYPITPQSGNVAGVTNLNTLFFRCQAQAQSTQADSTTNSVPQIDSQCSIGSVSVTAPVASQFNIMMIF